MNGKLITLEGVDGSGKGTQAAFLEQWLGMQGISLRKVSFPDYQSPSSALVKMYLSGEFGKDPGCVNPYAASSFYAVDRCAGFLKDWGTAYKSGSWILADRYTTSNMIYQISKLPKEEWDAFLAWVEDYEYGKLGLPRPDLTIYLDMPPGVSQKLLKARYAGDESKKDIHERDLLYLQHCRESAMYTAKTLGWRIISCAEGQTPRSIQDIHKEIVSILAASDFFREMSFSHRESTNGNESPVKV